MGCGSSIGGGGSTMSKDPEDFHLDHLDFKKMKVPEFDDYLIGELQPKVNEVVDIINEINSYIDDIKEAAVIVCRGFKVNVKLEGANEHDHVLLQLTKEDGTVPAPDEVAKLDAKVAAADAALSKARKALNKEMAGAYAALRVEGDLVQSENAPASLAAFNKALGDLRSAIGHHFKINVVVTTAGHGGAPSVAFDMTRAHFPDNDKDEYTSEPVSVIDVAKAKEAKNIFAAEQAVAVALAGLSKAIKAGEEASVSTKLTLKKSKLVPEFEGDDEEGATDKKSTIRKAVSTVNSQLFKLFKASRNANGNINVAKALVALFESFKKKVASLGPDALKQLKVSPNFKVTADGEVDFDFGIKLPFGEFEDKSPMEIIEKLLPGPAKLVLKAVMGVKDKIVELVPKFKPLVEEVPQLAEKATEVFSDPDDKIKAAFGETSDMFAIPKAVAAAVGNAKIAATEPIAIIKALTSTIMRLADELTASVTEIKALFPAAA